MNTVDSIDPRTGDAVGTVARPTTREEVHEICSRASAAARALDRLGRARRAAMLRAMATALEDRREDVVRIADRETALGPARLGGELTRTCFQLDFLAQVLDDGGYLQVAIDHAGDTAMGPRPDLRRMLVPVGPVAVFGASNFPLAFSVPGGDTASALAAGCPVVVKAHGSHPATSQLVGEILACTAESSGAPEGTFAWVHGVEAGTHLVAHPAIRAVGFTGSLSGGRALARVAADREHPIPFYGEMSSLNPVVVTPAAARERAQNLGDGLVASITSGAGQLCTKPGLVLVPDGEDGDRVVTAMSRALREVEAPYVLNGTISSSYSRASTHLRDLPPLQVLATGGSATGRGFAVAPALVGTTARQLPSDALDEVFGPFAVVVRYADEEDLLAVIRRLPSSLTATVHRGEGETALPRVLATEVAERAGRIVFDGYPTGVAVSWAQHHGGPWPATNSQHTSVGASSLERFLRPLVLQNAPCDLLPDELRDDEPGIPRRVDGVLMTVPRTVAEA